MTAITVDEVRPGLVVHLDHAALLGDAQVTATIPQIPSSEPRLFVCYAVTGPNSSWTPLTKEPKTGSGYPRIHIKNEWKSGGPEKWLKATSFLNDGANTYHGPSARFAIASASEESTAASRCVLSAAGLAAVRGEILNQLGRREKPAGKATGESLPGSGAPDSKGVRP
jgi:hypothetical protein